MNVENTSRPLAVLASAPFISGTPGRPSDASGLLPVPTASANIDDLMGLLETMTSSKDAERETSDVARLKTREAAHEKATNDNVFATRVENDAEPHGRGFFGSVGQVIKDVAHDAVTLHMADLVSDTKDDVGDALKSKQFWKDVEAGGAEVAKWGAVAASVAVAIGTGGAGAAGVVAVVAAVLSIAGATESEAHVLDRLHVTDEKGDAWVSMGLSLGGAVTGGAAGLAAGSSLTAAQSEAAAAKVGDASSKVAMASASADLVAGGAHIAVSTFDAKEVRANADALFAQMREKCLAHAVEDALAELRDNKKSGDKSMQSIEDAEQINQAATQQCVSWRA